MYKIVVALLALSLTACGMKRPLVFPPGPPEPILDTLTKPSPPEKPAPPANDLSTDKKPSSQ